VKPLEARKGKYRASLYNLVVPTTYNPRKSCQFGRIFLGLVSVNILGLLFLGSFFMVIWFGLEALVGRECLLELFSPVSVSDGRMGL
jgi:hypothetical protein